MTEPATTIPPIERMLVATDFSESSGEAAGAAGRIARVTQPRVHLFHAITPLPLGRLTPFVPAGASPENLMRQQKARAVQEMEKLRREHFDGVPDVTESTAVHRNTAAAICNAGDALDVDLTVVGTHGLTGASRLLYGSVAERVIRHASSSVLVVRKGTSPDVLPPRHVLCGVDFSEPSLLALDAALAWCTAFGARLSLLHCIDTRPRLARSLELADPALYQEQQSAELAAAGDELRQVIDTRLAGREADTIVVAESSPARAICEHAEKSDVDMVVVGTLGRDALARMLIGSVAERVARECPATTLVVRPRRR
jgi:nucleotide-binding universal stress UspA family protein